MRTSGRSPRMADVADRAGVSHQTVSRVVNGSPNVAPETQARVLAAIESLGYRPNRLARALVTQRSGVIGVAVARFGYYGPSSMVMGIDAAAREAGYATALVTLADPTPATVLGAVDQLVAEGAEAVLIISPERATADGVVGAAFAVPVVLLNTTPYDGTATVAVDQESGTRAAVEYLISLGHRRIAHLAGPDGWADAAARVEAWTAVLGEAGLEPGPCLVGDWSAASGHALTPGLLAEGVTAIFSANDQMAIGVLRALAEAGVDVPGDVSVIGFDDLPEAAYLHPPLTTVRQDFEALGRTAMELVLGAVRRDEGAATGARLETPELVVRSSTGPVRSRGTSA